MNKQKADKKTAVALCYPEGFPAPFIACKETRRLEKLRVSLRRDDKARRDRESGAEKFGEAGTLAPASGEQLRLGVAELQNIDPAYRSTQLHPTLRCARRVPRRHPNWHNRRL